MLKLALHKSRSEYLQNRYFFIAIESDRSKVLCMLYFIALTFTVESACFTEPYIRYGIQVIFSGMGTL